MQFEDLDVWKRACRLCVEIYKALKECKDFGFKDQITRSALSIPSNIAEGYERNTNKDATKAQYILIRTPFRSLAAFRKVGKQVIDHLEAKFKWPVVIAANRTIISTRGK